MKLTWQQRAATRFLAEAALREAVREMESQRNVGGHKTGSSSGACAYSMALQLARHGEQLLRQSEGDRG